MKVLTEELKDVLLDELKVYEEMHELTVKKTEIITSGRINDLDNITQVENSLILKLGQLEERREKVINNIHKHLGIKEDSTVTDLLNHIDNSDGIKQEIESITKKFSKVLNSLKEKNDLNSLLIKDTLEYIEVNINLLTNTSDRGIYNNKVQKEQTSQKISLFDTKA
ncbi:flagellar protein FlgN [Proteiniborus sp. MB09-C3]|uniref:flagellar protein FlgN n=1 Tax=Proteiniborus sp. MB09-C3 TaxID=3050072 RepID=UPI002554E560|nr:flagellar protein FlgN [Proteiniborus sp. MB09-C3]WIV12053.1 flagellar protein FlgN [Proteiniborus sp. MB09-C3]